MTWKISPSGLIFFLMNFDFFRKMVQNMLYGVIAQLIRALPLQGRGPGFESLLLHQELGIQLSWLERVTDNDEVCGSSPHIPTRFYISRHFGRFFSGKFLLSTLQQQYAILDNFCVKKLPKMWSLLLLKCLLIP